MSHTLGATTYPFLAVLQTVPSLELMERIEGPATTDEIMSRLTNVLENEGHALASARAAQ